MNLRSVGGVVTGLSVLIVFVACHGPEVNDTPSQAEPSHEVEAQVRRSPSTAPVRPTMADAEPKALAGIENVVAYGDRVLSGSVPHGEAGFRTLAALGIKTVISVDGAQPEVETARRFGLRYIHLPITYGGITAKRTLELAKAVESEAGPIYIHCHHGKHRSAGAAAAVMRRLGRLDEATVAGRMKVSGTASHYKGLLACAELTPAKPAELAAIKADFPERARTSSMVEAMVEMEERLSHLEDVRAAGWTVPADHPDLVPAAVAGRLTDIGREMLDLPKVKAAEPDFRARLETQNRLGAELEELILKDAPAAKKTALLKRIKSDCKSCHRVHRNGW